MATERSERGPMTVITPSLTAPVLRAWTTNLDRANSFFTALTEVQLLQEVAPGKNRLIYLWGHLAAVNDAMLPLLGIGPRLHPELDPLYLTTTDRNSAS